MEEILSFYAIIRDYRHLKSHKYDIYYCIDDANNFLRTHKELTKEGEYLRSPIYRIYVDNRCDLLEKIGDEK